MDTATQIAAIALGVSAVSTLIAVVSLGWTVYTAVHLNAARITTAVALQTIFGARPHQEVAGATVTNVGRAPTKVLSIWLCVGRPPSRLQRLLPRRLRRSESLIVNGYDVGLSAALPRALQPGDDASVYMPIDVVRGALQRAETNIIYARVTTSTAGSRTSSWIRATTD